MITNIANTLVTLLRQKQFVAAQEQLFAQDAISLEPSIYKERSVKGLKAILKKEKTFLSNIKHWHHFQVSDPVISKDYFSIRMMTDVTLLTKQKVTIDEIIIYQVTNGKISKEQFFYQ
ncbi:nuclear transport factor 2 family protein [Aquimarina sp. AD10]|uniref:SnoaL-like domain-containing protein n=1 Tax=Aquimarina sp. AD10 TaxID=1714849 RepID=UPI000E4F3615|nr:SnoaL-like domain-containing protein [Aquimarina sp. AD10]AXT61780.1 nuclear transport factor 2 family protein [Aquimarina sp. AD10]RKN02577.1 nuclear transport factor 2 family protein [Aquimarina sp. AD10]